MTRSQEHLGRAYRHVQAVAEMRSPKAKRIYGTMCHKLPILVRTNGLCQTLAFVEEKATGWDRPDPNPRAVAYHRLREHVAETLGVFNALSNRNRGSGCCTSCGRSRSTAICGRHERSWRPGSTTSG